MLTFLDLQNAVLRLSPNQLTANPADLSNVGAIVNDAYASLLRFRQWIAVTKTTVIATKAPYGTGTVTATKGSATITGFGTAFLSNVAAGEFLTISQESGYRITAVNADTQLTIEAPWSTVTLSHSGYQITNNRIPLPADAERVIRLSSDNWALQRDNGFMLDMEDSFRTISGTPLVYSEVTTYPGNSGVIEVELWPVPSANTTLALTYRATIPPLVAPTDTPVLPGDVIMKAAQAEGCNILASRTGESIWLTLGSTYLKQFVEMRDSLAREDRRRHGSRPVAFDAEDMPSMNDPGWLAAYRAIQTLSLTRVA